MFKRPKSNICGIMSCYCHVSQCKYMYRCTHLVITQSTCLASSPELFFTLAVTMYNLYSYRLVALGLVQFLGTQSIISYRFTKLSKVIHVLTVQYDNVICIIALKNVVEKDGALLLRSLCCSSTVSLLCCSSTFSRLCCSSTFSRLCCASTVSLLRCSSTPFSLL